MAAIMVPKKLIWQRFDQVRWGNDMSQRGRESLLKLDMSAVLIRLLLSLFGVDGDTTTRAVH